MFELLYLHRWPGCSRGRECWGQLSKQLGELQSRATNWASAEDIFEKGWDSTATNPHLLCPNLRVNQYSVFQNYTGNPWNRGDRKKMKQNDEQKSTTMNQIRHLLIKGYSMSSMHLVILRTLHGIKSRSSRKTIKRSLLLSPLVYLEDKVHDSCQMGLGS